MTAHNLRLNIPTYILSLTYDVIQERYSVYIPLRISCWGEGLRRSLHTVAYSPIFFAFPSLKLPRQTDHRPWGGSDGGGRHAMVPQTYLRRRGAVRTTMSGNNRYRKENRVNININNNNTPITVFTKWFFSLGTHCELFFLRRYALMAVGD